MNNLPAVLDPASRARLVSILGLLGSDFDGERAAAGLLASRLLKERGLRWDDVIPPPVRFAGGQSGSDRADQPDLRLCLHPIAALTEWERGFVQSVASRRRLSPKQIDVLRRIAGTLRERGCK